MRGLPSIRVFISSDIDEFLEERKLIAGTVGKLGLEPVMFERFGARTEDRETAFLQELDTCPIYVGIFGTEYSLGTRKEIEKALHDGKDVLVFVRESQTRNQDLSKLLKELETRVVYQKFSTKEDLASTVQESLLQLLARRYTPPKKTARVYEAVDLEKLDSQFEQNEKPYRRMAVYPVEVISSPIVISKELESWVSSNRPPCLWYCESFVRPNAYGFVSSSGDARVYGEVSDQRLVYYGETVDGRWGLHIGRNIVVTGQVLKFAVKFYQRIGYNGVLKISFKVGKAKGIQLTSDGPPSRFEMYLLKDNEFALVEQQTSTDELTKDVNRVTASLTCCLWRWFGLSIEEQRILEVHMRRLEQHWVNI